MKKIQVLNKCISETEVYSSTPKDMVLVFPSGDGMCLGFLQEPELPLNLAVQLQQKLAEYNIGKIPSETVRVRIGLHSGSCFIVKDIRGQDIVWGPGVILTKRVMDFGDDNHILLSSQMAEELRELVDDYRKIIRPVHDFVIKHGETILVYSACGDGFGNRKHPSKGEAQISKYGDEIKNIQKTTLYPVLQVDMSVIDSKNMVIQHKRTYEIINISDKPIDYILHGIATDVEKYSINDLNIHAYDEKNRELKISSVNIDKPTQKEFTTRFNDAIIKGEKGRKYTLIYEVEEPERYFENAFLIDVDKFLLNFKYPEDIECNPIIYDISQESGEKTKSKNQPKMEKIGKFYVARYTRGGNIRGESIRIEW